MNSFIVRCVLLISILLIGVLAGMQVANDGLKRMKGYNDPTFEQVAQIASTQNGDTEATLFGKTFTIEEKLKQLEAMKSFNLISRLGHTIAVGVQKTSQIATNAVIGKIEAVFRDLGK